MALAISHEARLMLGPSGRQLWLFGREHDEHPALVVIVGREDVRHRPARQIVLGVDLDGLALHPHLPLERRRDVVGAVLEAKPKHIGSGLPITWSVFSPVSSNEPLAAVEDPPLPSQAKKAASGAG